MNREATIPIDETVEELALNRRFRPYSEYRDSGVEWLGEIPTHWKVQKLKNVASLRFSNVDKKSHDDESPVQLCNYTDVYYNEHITSAIAFMDATASTDEIERFALKQGDVLITKDSEDPSDIAVPACVVGKLAGVLCGYHLAQVRPLPSTSHGPYLARAFAASGIRDHFNSRATGITRHGLSKDTIGGSHFFIPPHPEQQAIARFLDRETSRIDELIGKKQRLLELLAEKRTALISHAVTKGLNPDTAMKDSGIEWLGEVPKHWQRKKLSWLLRDNPKNGISPPAGSDGGVPTFSISAVRNGAVDIESHLKFANLDEGSATPFLVQIGDVLVLRGNGNKSLVGTCGIVKKEPPTGCIYPDILIRIRPGSLVTPWFLVECLNSHAIRPQVETASRTAAGIWKISGTSLQAIRLPVPPLVEQKEIQRVAGGLETKLREVMAPVERAIAWLHEYRSALISAAVTGKIDVREEITS